MKRGNQRSHEDFQELTGIRETKAVIFGYCSTISCAAGSDIGARLPYTSKSLEKIYV
jgi:hypothetical protein